MQVPMEAPGLNVFRELLKFLLQRAYTILIPIDSTGFETFQKKSGTYSSRVWENFELKNNKFEISDYESTTLPYGPEFNVKAIMNLIYKKVCIVF